MIYSNMCVLNNLDMLDSRFNKGTLDLEDELKEHPLYRDVYESILNYNNVYQKIAKKSAAGVDVVNMKRTDGIVLTPEGDYSLPQADPREEHRLVMDKRGGDMLLGLESLKGEERTVAMQAAREDVVYEFEMLMGRIVAACSCRSS